MLTTHYMEEAELLADRIAIIDHGEIQALDTPRGLIARLEGEGHIDFATSSPVDTDQLTTLPGVRGVTAKTNATRLDGPGLASYQLQVTDPARSPLCWPGPSTTASTCADWTSSPAPSRTSSCP